MALALWGTTTEVCALRLKQWPATDFWKWLCQYSTKHLGAVQFCYKTKYGTNALEVELPKVDDELYEWQIVDNTNVLQSSSKDK